MHVSILKIVKSPNELQYQGMTHNYMTAQSNIFGVKLDLQSRGIRLRNYVTFLTEIQGALR